jgi:ribonuclease I
MIDHVTNLLFIVYFSICFYFWSTPVTTGDMKVVGLAVALVAVLVVMSCLAPNSGAEAQSTSWDFLLLVQQWGPGVCATSRGKQCVIPSYVRYWTLHGMWPNNFDGSYVPSSSHSKIIIVLLFVPSQRNRPFFLLARHYS